MFDFSYLSQGKRPLRLLMAFCTSLDKDKDCTSIRKVFVDFIKSFASSMKLLNVELQKE